MSFRVEPRTAPCPVPGASTSHPISFEREIGGTVYTVNAHFSDQATETTEGKVKHILSKNITL